MAATTSKRSIFDRFGQWVSDSFNAPAEKKQEATMAVKEASETVLFSFFATAEGFLWFSTHILRLFLFPLIGATFLINTIIESYKLYYAQNKNAESIGGLIATALSAGLAIASITGTVLGALGIIASEFALGPFLFIGALSVGFLHQASMLLFNSIRFSLAPKGSIERKALLQDIARNAFQMILFTTIALTVTSVMISPMGPLVMAGLGISAAVLTGSNLAWRFMPTTWKHALKSFFHTVKPQIALSPIPSEKLDITMQVASDKTVEQGLAKNKKESTAFGHLFTASFRRHKVIQLINAKPINVAKSYLLREIEQKDLTLANKTQDSKTSSKRAVLAHLKGILQGTTTSLETIQSLTKAHPHAFQSFFAKTSDTEDLYQAVNTFVEARDMLSQTELEPLAM
jgi:hypothetical protein